jgi:hypothetical protein
MINIEKELTESESIQRLISVINKDAIMLIPGIVLRRRHLLTKVKPEGMNV